MKDLNHNTDEGRARPKAGSEVRELPSVSVLRTQRPRAACPQCGQKGKPVGGQTVKALLAASLRSVGTDKYYFCRTRSCPVVYFTADASSVYTTADLRERVYQKEPDAESVPICYCFAHTAGDLRGGSPEARAAILDDIQVGVDADQCACDLRNPQGSCCLGNVRALITELDAVPDKA